MIKSIKPLSLAEVSEILGGQEGTEKVNETREYTKKFLKLKTSDSKKMKLELENLGLIKLKAEHITKVVDIMPEDPEDVRKIFVDISLDENEIAKILEVVNKYR